ncbi:MAG: UDP-N-acetylglucosamine 2-epimerase (non-hydrolyzing) [Candidatus Omnitrophica bacterium]|nr:UDP-N-acetylglucosamine 2-epimerase (non-hydrolyzing) [Candidatus Omnitrophota bacterium]
MKKKKILLCLGTRPEALKLASLAFELKRHPYFQSVILLTGQHREMVDQVMRLFRFKPDYDLNLMTPNQTLSALSEKIIARMDDMLLKIKPDCLLVQGDTTTAFLTALSAFYRKIPVGHIEAGLRTDNKYQPFPEEINRRLITQLADFHFAPTEVGYRRLIEERVPRKKIIVTGNTGIDALLWMKKILSKREYPPLKLPIDKKIILVTAHRRESFGQPLRGICEGILRIAKNIPAVEIYYPVHLNPNVEGPVLKMLSGFPNIHLPKPLAYDELVYLMEKASLILTDSGGIQEEAPSFHKPVLVLRNVTERPEGVRAGFSRIVGQNPDRIFNEAKKCIADTRLFERLKRKKNPYGDGKAAARIIQFLKNNL